MSNSGENNQNLDSAEGETVVMNSSMPLYDEDTPTLKLVGHILYLSVPLGVAALAQISVGSVMVAMVGRKVGVEQLGGTSLAFSILYCTSFSIAAGCSGALETMLSYTYGKDPHSKLYGIHCQRMCLLLLFGAAISGPILAFADSFLIAIGQNPVVAGYTGQFCRIALIGVVPAMTLEVIRRYFACQHLNNPLSASLLIAAGVFPFVLYALISLFGYIGAPISWTLLQIGMPASLIAYLFVTKKYKKTWGGWDESALRNWGPLCKLAFPSMVMMLSEWASLEVNCLSAGYATPPQLAAFSTIYLLSGLLWSWTSGVYITVAVLVGNSIGEGRNMFGRRCAILCLLISMGFAIFDILILVTFQSYIPRLFSTNEETIATFPRLLPVFCIFHFFDLIQSCMMGVLRGCGMQKIGAIAIAVVYSIVGVPLGMTIFFTTNVGVLALWIGPTFGVTAIGAPLYFYLMFYYIPWSTVTLEDENVLSEISEEERTWSATHPASVVNSDASSSDEDNTNFETASVGTTDFVVPQRNILYGSYLTNHAPAMGASVPHSDGRHTTSGHASTTISPQSKSLET